MVQKLLAVASYKPVLDSRHVCRLPSLRRSKIKLVFSNKKLTLIKCTEYSADPSLVKSLTKTGRNRGKLWRLGKHDIPSTLHTIVILLSRKQTTAKNG